LQGLVSRLRKKISLLENATNGENGRRCSGFSTSSDLDNDDVAPNGTGQVSPLKTDQDSDDVEGG